MNKKNKLMLNKIKNFRFDNMKGYNKSIYTETDIFWNHDKKTDNYVFFINKSNETLLAIFGALNVESGEIISIKKSYLSDLKMENELNSFYDKLYYSDTTDLHEIVAEFDYSLKENYDDGLVEIITEESLEDLLSSFDKLISNHNYNNVKEGLITSFKKFD